MEIAACTLAGLALLVGVATLLRLVRAGVKLTLNAMHTTLSDAQVNAIFDLERMRTSEGDDDLVAIGAAAIGALVGVFLAGR